MNAWSCAQAPVLEEERCESIQYLSTRWNHWGVGGGNLICWSDWHHPPCVIVIECINWCRIIWKIYLWLGKTLNNSKLAAIQYLVCVCFSLAEHWEFLDKMNLTEITHWIDYNPVLANYPVEIYESPWWRKTLFQMFIPVSPHLSGHLQHRECSDWGSPPPIQDF